MKKIIFACLVAAQVYAYTPPPPIEGFAVGATPGYSLSYEGMDIAFSLPREWGLGHVESDEKGLYFIFFPIYEECGFTVQISSFNTEVEVKEEVLRLRKTFSNVQDIADGFEAIFSNAYYSCHSSDSYVIETWYSLNRERSADDDAFWNATKSCVVVSALKQ